MKTKDLSIGSFVRYEGDIVKIISIQDDNNTIGCEGKKGYLLVSCWIERLSPIEITNNLLDANFKSDKNAADFPNNWVFEDLVISECQNDEENYVLGIVGYYRSLEMFGIKYVHELQQWLNILKIEKDIEL